MSENRVSLDLRIFVDSKIHTFVLKPGREIFIGRDSSCDLQILLDSISLKHLRIFWDASELIIQDLNSSNGSFRMPQDSPFLEARFSELESSVSLRMAKVPLTIEWQPFEVTQVVELSPTEIQEPVVEKPDTSASVLGFLWIFLFSCVVFYLQFTQFDFFLRAPDALLALGAIYDFAILYVEWILSNASLFILGGALLGFFLLQKVSTKKWTWKLLLGLPIGLRTSYFLSLSLLVASFLWPGLWSYQKGNFSTKTYQDIFSVIKIRAGEETVKAEQFQLIKKTLLGSSYVYEIWYNSQKKKLAQDCRAPENGEEQALWEQKRFCLFALYALSIESLTQFQPVLSFEIAQSLVLISSIDGLIRVLVREGPQSANLRAFLEPLDIDPMRADLDELLLFMKGYQDKSFSDLVQGLLGYKVKIEERLKSQRARVQLPVNINFMGPLELGI